MWRSEISLDTFLTRFFFSLFFKFRKSLSLSRILPAPLHSAPFLSVNPPSSRRSISLIFRLRKSIKRHETRDDTDVYFFFLFFYFSTLSSKTLRQLRIALPRFDPIERELKRIIHSDT